VLTRYEQQAARLQAAELKVPFQTVASVVAFFLAMLLYPEVQKKGQLEVDSVTGGKRLPDFADSPQLPYVNAIVLEALRWLPVAPMGLLVSICDDQRD
jgi:cytochrome P450